MSGDPQKYWSGNPWAPRITPRQYSAEETYLSGHLICAIFYGIVIALFFQCMSALLYPADRMGAHRGIRQWWLVAHAVAMFLIVTVCIASDFSFLSTCYIENREYPGNGFLAPGPFGYQFYLYLSPVTIIRVIAFSLNQWLADGLLLYRCYIVYGASYWVIAFPFLMYLVSIAMGIVYIYQSVATPLDDAIRIDFSIPSNSISFALSILLTLMIVARLVLQSRRIRDAMGPGFRPSGFYKTTITILVESYALYAVSNLLFLAPWAAGHRLVNVFFPIFVQVQVIAPLLIILRVANRSALTSQITSPGTTATIRFGSNAKSAGGNGTISDGHPMRSVDTNGETIGDFCVGVENSIGEITS